MGMPVEQPYSSKMMWNLVLRDRILRYK